MTSLTRRASSCQAHAADPKALGTLFHSILLMCKIYYSLISQDFPDEFVESIAQWMGHFAELLSLPDIPSLANDVRI